MRKTDWKEFHLGDIATILSGGDAPRGHISKFKTLDYCVPIYSNGISAKGLYGYTDKATVFEPATTISARGTIGAVYKRTEPYLPIVRLISVIGDRNIVDSDFLYYNLCGTKISGNGSVQAQLTVPMISEYIVRIPDVATQKKIAQILSCLDAKIELNTRINQKLEAQAEALFDKNFGPGQSIVGGKGKAEQFFEINIGKTPPRKEHEWFSNNPTDVTWVSISDMGTCGMYILDSSEYLTKEAVAKFNIKVVPAGSILLSFKLTVGRVAIADCPLTTNEAIAHFKYSDPAIREYLYFYLKKYDYQTLGSTSSIAIAVNSKMIKSLPFTMPDEDALKIFHRTCAPLFDAINLIQHENIRLSTLRDTLLPKLMSGEIDVSEVEI